MSELNYLLILEETSPHHYDIFAPQFPTFHSYVTGAYPEEAVDRAYSILLRWIVSQKEKGEMIPPPSKGGYVLYGAGAHRNETENYWSKRDLIRVTGLSRATIDRRIKDGTLIPKRMGRRALFDPKEVRETLAGKFLKSSDLQDRY